MARLAVLAALAGSVAALDNGRAVTPPLGWRSWNLYGANVDQSLMLSQMDGMVARTRAVWSGAVMSLWDLGYRDVGLDDNWQKCGSYGPDKYTFHTEEGVPVVNTDRFPDFINMTTYAHSLNLTAGWYGNNCICNDHCDTPNCYQGDVDAAFSYGFDSIKLDGCGQERDLTLYASLFNATGKAFLIENCHWGGTVPNATWCPWSYFRSSGDIAAAYSSIVSNLLTTVQWAKSGLSGPNCWAYPDMLEVGVFKDPVHPGAAGLSLTEMKTHFNAWCVVSSPLILSHDTNNATLTDAIWPIISNTEAIAVNQAWAGYSGSVFLEANSSVTLSVLQRDGATRDEAVPAWSAWNKPIGGGKIAVLVMNNADVTQTITVPFAAVPGLSSNGASLRDIDAHKELGSFTNSYSVTLASHDSAFYILTPQ